ncbi:MAG: aquaporin family protein [Balneolaceae bacterium]|nr:aquaporin family protein [Balneolaceae bacterium]
MEAYLGEILGTFLLILLGNGVVANVLLKDTKGNGAGWVVITLAWGFSVFVAVFVVAGISGAHINPAVTLGLALAGKFSWDLVMGYILAQMIGAILGGCVVWLHYKDHYDITEEADLKLATFSTAPAIRNTISNLISEAIGTFVLVLGVLYMAAPEVGLGALDALPVALLVVVIGMSLGGTTGYAINPARDLGPRIAHFILPIKGKGDSDWSYSWIPVVGPIIGGALAALLFLQLPF